MRQNSLFFHAIDELDTSHTVLAALRDPANPITSIRDVERMVTRAYIATIVRKEPYRVAGQGEDPQSL